MSLLYCVGHRDWGQEVACPRSLIWVGGGGPGTAGQASVLSHDRSGLPARGWAPNSRGARGGGAPGELGVQLLDMGWIRSYSPAKLAAQGTTV